MIPPNRPNVREDRPDRLYATADDGRRARQGDRPRCTPPAGPSSSAPLDVAESERLARRLRRAGVECVVLNAKNDDKEAGDHRRGGRVQRGHRLHSDGRARHRHPPRRQRREGPRRVEGLGGLFVIGTARNDSRRIDDQLRGRAGRQGDPGESVFFASLEDELVTRYAPDAKPMAAADDDGPSRTRTPTGRRPRPARRRGRRPGDPPQHLALQPPDRPAPPRAAGRRRDAVLHGDAADEPAGRARPGPHAELTEIAAGGGGRRAPARSCSSTLDRCWAEHLAYLADLREGIHLRSLGRGLDPLMEFHREAVPAGKRLLADARKRAVAAFERSPPPRTASTWTPPGSSGRRRRGRTSSTTTPSAPWTSGRCAA